MPKVSVIIPVYNAEKYLRECLDSVVNQTLRDIEILCVDDGSTDDSLNILHEYEKGDSRFSIIIQNNQGAGKARNAGIAIAKGRYIAFMDSDDYYPDEKVLEILFKAATQNEALICGGSVAFLRRRKIVPAELAGVKYYFSKAGWIEYRDYQQDYYYQRFLFSREMLIQHNLFFPYYRRYQDAPFFVKAMLQAERFYAISEIVYIYREGASNALWTEQKVLDRLEGIRDELNTTREAKLEQLHGRVVQRIRNTLRAIQTETDLAEDERIKQAFLRIYREIDKDAVFEYCTADELEYLQMYLEDQLASEDQMEGIISVKRGKACQNYTYIPKVSIIVPVYNVDLYLRECMNSLVHQTLYEIEIICVNDESPDSSHEILEEYFQKDDRITIISQKNKGLSGARNTGMMFAQGEYIHFIDSDDYLSLDAMEKLYAVCKARNLDAVYFDYTRFYDNGTAAPQLVRREHCDIYDGVSFLKTLKDENAFTPTAWSQMLRREFLRENNIAFYQGIIHEDNLFTFYVLMEAKRVSHVGEKLYHHRLRANSIMTVPQSHKNAIGYFISMQEMMLYGLENKRSRTKEAEILRAFDSMRKNTSYVLAKLSHQEKEKIQFQNPFSQLLFDMFFMRDGQAAVQTTVVADSAGKNGSSSRSAQEREMKILKAEIHRLELEIRSIHLSATYRIGRFFTWIPRKVRGGIRCYREHGLGYTLNRVLVHLHLAEDTYTADNERKNITASGEKTTAKEIVRDADYYKKLPAEKYEEELKIWYKRITKRELNLTNPKTFNEKIQWLKLYDTTPLKTMLADKYLVRDWVKDRIGEQYLVRLFGVWDSFDDIDFNKLPDRFVLKANHGCGWNIIVKDKKSFNVHEARQKFQVWMNTNYAYKAGLELQYLNISPKIIAEEYLENGKSDLYDYKVFCFNGKAESIMFLSERSNGLKMAFYDLKWNKLPISYTYPMNKQVVPKPKNLELLISLAEKLAEGFPHVRVDFYILNDGTFKFGEMTFSSASGLCNWNPREQDAIYGELIKLPSKKNIPINKVRPIT